LEITATGLKEFQDVGDNLIESTIRSLEPISIPPQATSGYDYTLNVTDLLLDKISFVPPQVVFSPPNQLKLSL
jgi:hypothetical protein